MCRRAAEEQRATFLELLFDLVFVFAVTQLSVHLLEHLTVEGAGQTMFLLLAVWWAWIYTTWMPLAERTARSPVLNSRKLPVP